MDARGGLADSGLGGDLGVAVAEYLAKVLGEPVESEAPHDRIERLPAACECATAPGPGANTTSSPRSRAATARGSKGAMWL
ncbi:hypothetical protein [Amycolatopsis regifaucium]|nr:hypothetical protein [Amycolatopsis regifaucium]SFJ75662.1 hypothetical protein SAMN04489731_1431 [Amycolatopsis regifaucium]